MLRATFQSQRCGPENVTLDCDDHRKSLLKNARFLLNLRDELEMEENRMASRRMDLARRYLLDEERAEV
jgi:hypothetical protein